MKKGLIILAIFLTLGGGYYYKNKSVKTELKKYAAININTGTARGYLEAEGSVEANDTKKVFVHKKLKVKDVFIQEGDYIEKGQLLMTFDETERNNIMRNLEKERMNLAKLKRDMVVEQELYKIGGTSLNYIKDMADSIRKSEIAIESYEEDLAKTAEKVESPVSGTVTNLKAQENYLVDTDNPLLEITDLSDIKIVLEVPEYDVKDVKLGQKLEVKPEVFEKTQSYSGTVTKISRVSKVSKKTSENVLQVEVKPIEVIPHIVPGFSVSAILYLEGKRNQITVPKTALLESEGSYFVFAAENSGILSKKSVKIETLKGEMAVISEGIQDGDRILTVPDENLKEGERVEVEMIRAGAKKEGAGNVKNRKSK